ncbi:hypothetical protein BH10PSE16_BH10PSE16_01300 [soil metagenome]
MTTPAAYPSYESVMGPVLAAIANGTLIPPRPARKPLPALVLPAVSTLTPADRIEIDHYMHQDKENDGYEKRRVAKALKREFQRNSGR